MRYSDAFSKSSSKILLGTAYFGETISREEAFEIIDKYVFYGGNHLDTARYYADGESEKVIAQWFKSRRPQNVFVSTKGGFPRKESPDVPRLNEKEIRYDLELSLKALETDCINFYWLHRDDENIPAGEIIEIMNALKKEGKILHFGASNWKYKRIDDANSYAREHKLSGFEASQIRFSPAVIAPNGDADRTLVDIDRESFKYYGNIGIPVAAYASQAKGFFSKMSKYGESGLSQKARDRYLCDDNLKRLELVKRMSQNYNCSIAAAVCAALCSIDYPDVFPVIGSSNAKQIADSIKGADIIIPQNELKDIFSTLY